VCAKLAGEPSLARVELFTQNAYFVFQVVQVFLVVTIASSASSIIQPLLHNPSGITKLLANRLPTVSNFYISYFIVQGLSISSGVLSQVVGFVIFRLMYKYLAGTPRSLYTKWSNLSAISWGSTLPVFTNIAVIGKCSSELIPTLTNKPRYHLLLYRTFGSWLCYHRHVFLLSRLPLQHPLRDRLTNRHERSNIPTRSPATPHRCLYCGNLPYWTLCHQCYDRSSYSHDRIPHLHRAISHFAQFRPRSAPL
jgi:hypothetical protein